MNDFGILVARHLTTLPTLSDTQLSELTLDASGRLIISGRYLEDSAHVSGDAGLFIMGVRNDTDAVLTSNDGDYSPLSVDDTGRLKVATVVSVEPSDAEFAEDTPNASGDVGIHVLAVRQDTLASSTDTDGDYADFKVNALGELYVHDTDANASLNSIEASSTAIAASVSTIATEIQSITHVEDTAHSSGHVGTMPLAVRNDANTSLVDTDGDYAPLQVNSVGRLKVDATATLTPVGSEEYTVTDALAAGGDGLVTITAAATPWVTVASFVHTAGIAYIYGIQWACDQNADARLITDDTTDIVVYKRTLNSSAAPTWAEHWNDGGRIEIAGATDLEIKLQIKKRSTTGGNALGTGSIHMRK